MLYALYLILLVGGMILVGISFASPWPPLLFILGVLCIAAAVAAPITAQRFDR